MKLLYTISMLVIAIAAMALWMIFKGEAANTLNTGYPTEIAPPVQEETLAQDKKQLKSARQIVAKRFPEKSNKPLGDDPDLNETVPDDYPTLETRLDEMSSRRNGQIFDSDAVNQALQKPSA